MQIELKCYIKKMGNCQLSFMKRTMPIISWLKIRYNLKSENCDLKMVFKDDDKENKKITLIFNFK